MPDSLNLYFQFIGFEIRLGVQKTIFVAAVATTAFGRGRTFLAAFVMDKMVEVGRIGEIREGFVRSALHDGRVMRSMMVRNPRPLRS
jgi:hypothetical protein